MNTIQSQPTVIDLVLRRPRFGRSSAVAPVVAETTATPGLVITPHLDQAWHGAAWTFTGEWDLRHEPSGIQPAWIGGGLGHARDLAALLGELDVDWTQPAERLPLRDPVVQDAVARIRAQLHDAARAGCPARTRPSSWIEVPPPYWLADRGGRFLGDYCWSRWSDAADEAVDGWHESAVVVRGDAAWWDLRCAAADCTDRLGLGLDDDEARPDRGSVADFAHDLGWRALDHEHRTWLCPRCRPLFAPHRP